MCLALVKCAILTFLCIEPVLHNSHRTDCESALTYIAFLYWFGPGVVGELSHSLDQWYGQPSSWSNCILVSKTGFTGVPRFVLCCHYSHLYVSKLWRVDEERPDTFTCSCMFCCKTSIRLPPTHAYRRPGIIRGHEGITTEISRSTTAIIKKHFDYWGWVGG